MRPMDIENSGGGSSSQPSSPSHHAPTHHTTTSTVGRFMYLLVLSLGMFLVAYEILRQSNIEVEHVKVRVKNAVGRIYDKTYKPEDDPYEPLEIGEMFADWDFDGNNYYKKEENATTTKTITTGGSIITNKKKKNPRMTCFMDARATCASLMEQDVIVHVDAPYSIPKKIVSSSGKSSDSSSEDDYIHGEETEICTLSDPSYQSIPAAPSTCNDVHALPFRFGPTESQPISGLSDVVYTSRHSTKYLTSGGFRAVWTITQLFEEDAEEDRVIMKTNMMRRGWGPYYLDQNRRDILISERAGSSHRIQPLHSNVLPVYQYCAFSSVVPFSTAGPLDDYMSDRKTLLTANEQYNLALQAARGLYQAQLYKNGKATHVHADVKPPQFLLFDRPGKNATKDTVPIMQLNDFNRGKFLTRNKDNETCPFTMCHVHHKGSTYRAPEEYMECAEQADTIDVFSLGGVFFYLLSDGEKPWYHLHSEGLGYNDAVKGILNGEKPRLPNSDEYRSDGEKIVQFVKERSKHPAFVALKEIMTKCWAFKPEDRPSSKEVVQMLEKKWSEIKASKSKR